MQSLRVSWSSWVRVTYGFAVDLLERFCWGHIILLLRQHSQVDCFVLFLIICVWCELTIDPAFVCSGSPDVQENERPKKNRSNLACTCYVRCLQLLFVGFRLLRCFDRNQCWLKLWPARDVLSFELHESMDSRLWQNLFYVDWNEVKRLEQNIQYHWLAALSAPSQGLRYLVQTVRDIEDYFGNGIGAHQSHPLPQPVWIGCSPSSTQLSMYDTVTVERRMNSITCPWMLRLSRSEDEAQPSKRWILKPEDIGREACAMEVIRSLNNTWEASGIEVRGQRVWAKTYQMLLVRPHDSLVEVVENCVTLGSLKRTSGLFDRMISSILQSDSRPGRRVERYLQNDGTRLDCLAASTAAFLACSYLLGIGDGHGDNFMLTEDGELFRVDFSFLFGDKPRGFDAPVVWLPWTVQEAERGPEWTM